MNKDRIKYNLSTDYDRLLDLIKNGNIIVGFVPLSKMVPDVFKLIEISYESDYKIYNLGFTFFEQDLKKISFSDLCEKEDVKFIDVNFTNASINKDKPAYEDNMYCKFYECPKCKAIEVIEDDKFCSNCGIKINWK